MQRRRIPSHCSARRDGIHRIRIDTAFLSGMSKELERQLDNLVAQIYDDAGEKFNINSTQQLSVILFDKLKLAPVRKTKTGFSTDVSVLEALRKEHPIVERMLDYRQLSKLKSTYVDALPNLFIPQRDAFIPHLIKRLRQQEDSRAATRTCRTYRSAPTSGGDTPRVHPRHKRNGDHVGGLFADRTPHHGAYLRG